MPNKTIRDSLERVDKYLQENKEFVAITQISKDLNLQNSSIKKCVETLRNFGRVEIATNGNIFLVKKKSEVQNAD